jgi:multidrug efflux system membrane fusion protein
MPGHAFEDQHLPPRTPGMDRTRIWAGLGVLLLALGIGGVFAWPHLRSQDATAAEVMPPPPDVTVSKPLQRQVAAWTRFTGQFSAVDNVDLRAQVSGFLTEIHFTDGQIVHRGDLLFVIDPRPFEIQLQQATAQYQSALAGLQLADEQLKRTSTLQHSDFASRDLLDQRLQAQRGAQASVEQAKAAIRSAQLNLEFSRITAPFDGRIGAHQVSVGSLISGGNAGGSNTLLATVVSMDPIHLDFDMSESDYLSWRRYQEAQPKDGAAEVVQASLSDEQGWTRKGHLDFVDNRMDRGSGTMHARASLPNSDLLIAPGQFGTLRLPTAASRQALLVPDAALVTDQSNKLVMVVAADGTVVPKLVQTGQLSDGLREITSGLSADDRVIINGLMRARPGTKVTPQQGTITTAASS